MENPTASLRRLQWPGPGHPTFQRGACYACNQFCKKFNQMDPKAFENDFTETSTFVKLDYKI